MDLDSSVFFRENPMFMSVQVVVIPLKLPCQMELESSVFFHENPAYVHPCHGDTKWYHWTDINMGFSRKKQLLKSVLVR